MPRVPDKRAAEADTVVPPAPDPRSRGTTGAAAVSAAPALSAEELKHLFILTEIAEAGDRDGGELSQRGLAHRLGMAVGLVNAFLKKLARKGYIKVTTLPARRMKYFITPRGAAEKLRLTYEFLAFSYRYFREAHRNASNLFRDLSRAGVRRLAFYGAEDLTEVAALSLAENELELVAVADDEAVGRSCLGRTVVALDGLDGLSFDRIVLTTIRRREDAALLARLRAKGEVLRIY
jgi:DNA-binding MarR family transcriptional regulator